MNRRTLGIAMAVNIFCGCSSDEGAIYQEHNFDVIFKHLLSNQFQATSFSLSIIASQREFTAEKTFAFLRENGIKRVTQRALFGIYCALEYKYYTHLTSSKVKTKLKTFGSIHYHDDYSFYFGHGDVFLKAKNLSGKPVDQYFNTNINEHIDAMKKIAGNLPIELDVPSCVHDQIISMQKIRASGVMGPWKVLNGQ